MRPIAIPAVVVAVLVGAVACRSAPAPAPVTPAPVTPTAVSQTAAPPAEPGRDDRLGALLWAQTSAEYRILATTTYAAAVAALDRALGDPTWTAAVEQGGDFAALPPAVIVDVDETVLDNSPYEAQTILAGHRYEKESWGRWIESAQAEPIPGAVEFARYAASRGVTIYYVTNRDAEEEAATRRNLVEQGFPVPDEIDTVLVRGERPEYVSDKTSRRAEVAAKHRVLLLIGDDLNDFVPATLPTPQARIALAEQHASRWGRGWFLLPNPDYGTWERALYGNDRGLAEGEILKRKLQHLRLPK
jgi:acid phosphatase